MSDVAELRAADVDAGSSQCRACGCTDHYGCRPRCWWVEPDLCSNCARRASAIHLEPTASRAEVVDVVNALAAAIEIIADQVQMILDVLELDEQSVWREVVDLPDIATYQEPT